MHSCSHSIGMSPVAASMSSQRILGWHMTGFARAALRDLDPVGQTPFGNGLKRRMADRTSRTLGWISEFQYLRQALGAGGLERGIGPVVMKIGFGPNRVLMFVI